MADVLNIIVLPTYDVNTLAIADASSYDVPGNVTENEIEITPPGFNLVTLPFTIQSTNVFNSTHLGITSAGEESSIPDGVYCFKYMIDPQATTYVEKSIMRVDNLQQKFDEAFMQLDMMECDRSIKTQSKVTLNTIYFLIQGAIASANNCAIVQSATLYTQANSMLDSFITNNCGCSGNNYLINFQYT